MGAAQNVFKHASRRERLRFMRPILADRARIWPIDRAGDLLSVLSRFASFRACGDDLYGKTISTPRRLLKPSTATPTARDRSCFQEITPEAWEGVNTFSYGLHNPCLCFFLVFFSCCLAAFCSVLDLIFL